MKRKKHVDFDVMVAWQIVALFVWVQFPQLHPYSPLVQW